MFRFIFYLLILSSSLSVHASLGGDLISELNLKLNEQPLSGGIYRNSKFYGRFQTKITQKVLSFSVIGRHFIDYKYSSGTQKLVFKKPKDPASPGLILDSSTLQSLEWLLSALNSGVLSSNPNLLRTTLKHKDGVDIYASEISDSALSEIQVAVLNVGETRLLLSLQAKDHFGNSFLLLFD